MSGTLPDSLSSVLYLQNLNLADNNFNGSIPASWGQLPQLKHLVVRGNHLTGSIPESLTNITGLLELFTATHPSCGGNLQQPCVSSSSIPVSKRNQRFRFLSLQQALVHSPSSCSVLSLVTDFIASINSKMIYLLMWQAKMSAKFPLDRSEGFRYVKCS